MQNELLLALIAVIGAFAIQIPTLVGFFVLWGKGNVDRANIAAATHASAAKVDVDKNTLDVNQNKYILDQLTSVQNQLNTMTASLLDTTAKLHDSAVESGKKDVKIAQLTASLELQNNETITLLKEHRAALVPIAAGVILANQQLTEDQRKHSLASSDTQAETDAQHAANVLKDYNSTQGVVHVVLPDDHVPTTPQPPVSPDGVAVSIVGTLKVTPDDDKPPTPAGAIDPDSSEVLKAT